MKPQLLFIETAQSHFVDGQGQLFSFPYKFRQADAKKAGLSPVTMVSLWVPVHTLSFTKAFRQNEKVDIKSFILEAWSKNRLKFPETLVVNELIAKAFPDIEKLCELFGVSLSVVPKGNKVYVATRRRLEPAFEGLNLRGRYDEADESSPRSNYKPWLLSELNQCCAWRESYGPPLYKHLEIYRVTEEEIDKEGANKLLVASKSTGHLTLNRVVPQDLLVRDEKKIPGRSKAWIKEEMDARMAGEYQSDQPTAAQDIYDEDDEDGENTRAVKKKHHEEAEDLTFDGANDIKELLPGWPVSKAKIARNVGLEAPEIDWFLTMKKGLRHDDARRLRLEFGLVATDYVGEFRVDMGLVLRFAKERSGAVNAYDRLSHGGDVEKAFELIPKNGVLNPKWQAIYLMACGDLTGNLLFFERGSKAAVAVTNKKMLINRSDEDQEFKVSNKMYADAMLIADQTINSCAEMDNAMNRFYGNNRAEIEKSFDHFPSW